MTSFLPAIHRYVNIVLFKTYGNLKAEIEKTYLGCIWWILEPIINTAVFYFIFVHVLCIRTENFAVFLYVGITLYGWFAGGVNAGANSIIMNAGIIQQIYLPKYLFPVIAICNMSWKFLFSLIVLFPLLWFNHAPITWTYIALPLLVVIQFFLIVAVTLPLAGLIPYFQDGRTVLATVLSVLMWLSGIMFSPEHVPGHLKILFYSNPIAVLIEAYRAVLIRGEWPDWKFLLIPVAWIIIAGLIGLFVMKKIDRTVTKHSL